MAARFRIVAVVDPSPTASAPDGVPLLRDKSELGSIGPIDFVDICTPTGTHLGLTLWALGAGYHVLCEKPVAVDRAQAAQIREAALRAGRIVMPCHQYRYNPAWQQMGRWLLAGLIGHWHLAELGVYRPGGGGGGGGGGPAASTGRPPTPASAARHRGGSARPRAPAASCSTTAPTCSTRSSTSPATPTGSAAGRGDCGTTATTSRTPRRSHSSIPIGWPPSS